MADVSRFIQFNNEHLDARQMLRYETLCKALTDHTNLSLTERQLIEMNTKDQKFALSVFWRHREQQIMHYGRLSDLYIMAAGFWRLFNRNVYNEYVEKIAGNTYVKLRKQLLLLVEEFRIMELLGQLRPGMQKAFEVRRKTYIETYRHQLDVHLHKRLKAEALMNYCYIAAHKGTIGLENVIDETFAWQFQQIYDVKSTEESIYFVERLMPKIEAFLEKDLAQNFYALFDTLPTEQEIQQQMKKAPELTDGDTTKGKETIEELFRTWHRASKEEEGTHLRFDLDRGNQGKSLSLDAEEGEDTNAITETAIGNAPEQKTKPKKHDADAKKMKRSKKKRAQNAFGNENKYVTYEEKIVEKTVTENHLRQLYEWRYEQAPYVKALKHQFQKEMAQKMLEKRQGLSYGRLQNKALLQFMTETRPKPFYKKGAPAKPLDAVFGLLVDGSASMLDKLDDTKRAVLLFHDVLRELKIAHDIVSFYEDAYEATEEEQPNTFEWLHQMENVYEDDGDRIMALEAHEDNRDGFAIRWMVNRLEKREEKHKFLLLFSDGEPSAFNYANNGVLDTAEAVLQAEKKGVTILHLFLNVDQPTEEQLMLFQSIYGNKTITAKNVEQFSEMTLSVLKKLIRHALQSMSS